MTQCYFFNAQNLIGTERFHFRTAHFVWNCTLKKLLEGFVACIGVTFFLSDQMDGRFGLLRLRSRNWTEVSVAEWKKSFGSSEV